MNWGDRAAVREYKRLDMRRRRHSTRTQERLNLNWQDRDAVNGYKQSQYARHNKWFRWRCIVERFLGPIPTYRSRRLALKERHPDSHTPSDGQHRG